VHDGHQFRGRGQFGNEVGGDEVVRVEAASGGVVVTLDGGLVGHHVDDDGACRFVAGVAVGPVAFARQAVRALFQGAERVDAPLGMGAGVVGADGGGEGIQALIEGPAVDHPQEAADLADAVAAVPDLDPAVVALLGAPPLGVTVVADHDAIHAGDELASVQRRPACQDLCALGVDGGKTVGIGDQLGARDECLKHEVVDFAGTEDLPDLRQPAAHRDGIADPVGCQALADP